MYNALVEAFQTAQLTSLSAYRHAGELAAQIPAPANEPLVPIPADHDAECRRFLRRLVASLIERASREFGIEGAPVSIDETRISVNGYPNVWEAIRAGETPDLDRFWRVLGERYQACGKQLAYRQIASTLANALQLVRPNAVRKHAKVVRLKLWAESTAVPAPRPSRRIVSEAYADVQTALLSLAAYAKDSGDAALAGCLRQFDHGEVFLAQQRRTFPGLDILQYNEYWELRFAAPIGEGLLQFIAQHTQQPAGA